MNVELPSRRRHGEKLEFVRLVVGIENHAQDGHKEHNPQRLQQAHHRQQKHPRQPLKPERQTEAQQAQKVFHAG